MFLFYLQIFFDFLDIVVVNSKIIYDNIDSMVGLLAMEFPLSLNYLMIRTFLTRKRVTLMY